MTDTNKRAAPRLRVLKTGKIVSKDYKAIFDCTVRDLSNTGAKLKCANPATVPNEMLFVLPSDGTMWEAKVIWRKPDTIGIHFTSGVRKAPIRKWG
ncbi:MAG: PilZ domain-containing protein [Rhizobiales bacterium]|nr:PilZ domain-containing protein [Hyphomicrobiales bacterium]